ncbi:cerebellin-1-like [Haliotis cracherodii]|uniref:heavy metal-binding protein HIP-like n=1 Tax=Haliotis rufescens TaxID=6454 RepID=UPI001EB021A9|nr:heavy metal-binding protein HIP-like [Haliotis rufescens]
MTRETALVLLSIIVYVSSAHKVEKAAAIPTRYNAWAAGSNNCSCASDITALKREILQEVHQRQELKGALETYVSELYELRALVTALKNATKVARATALSAQRDPPAIAFTAKLSYNRELQPLDTVIFDTTITNNGEGYNSETGKFTAPLSGSYYFFATVLSGYNTKVETAVIVNDKEVSRMYSGAHDAHGSGSNAAVVNLRSGDSVWIRLLYQGGTHVHGFYSTFSGFILNEKDP